MPDIATIPDEELERIAATPATPPQTELATTSDADLERIIQDDYLRRAITPRSAVGSFVNTAVEPLPGALGSLIGASLGGLPGAVAGGVLANQAKKAQERNVMGDEGVRIQQMQDEIDRQAHPYATAAGSFFGMAPSMAAGGGVAKKLAATALGKTAIGRGIAHLAETGGSFGTMEASQADSLKDVPGAFVHGAVTGAPLAFIPGAKSLLGTVGWNAPSQAALLSVTGSLWDHYVHGAPLNVDDTVKRALQDLPGFAMMNLVTGILGRQPILPRRAPPLVPPPAGAAGTPPPATPGAAAATQPPPPAVDPAVHQARTEEAVNHLTSKYPAGSVPPDVEARVMGAWQDGGSVAGLAELGRWEATKPPPPATASVPDTSKASKGQPDPADEANKAILDEAINQSGKANRPPAPPPAAPQADFNPAAGTGYGKAPLSLVQEHAEYGVKAAQAELALRQAAGQPIPAPVPTQAPAGQVSPLPGGGAGAIPPAQATVPPLASKPPKKARKGRGGLVPPPVTATAQKIEPAAPAAATVSPEGVSTPAAEAKPPQGAQAVKQPWEMTFDQFNAQGGSPHTAYKIHSAAVEKAVADGLPVPPEVLADYPELTPKPPSAEATASPPSPVAGEAVSQPSASVKAEPINKAGDTLFVVGPDGKRYPISSYQDASRKWESMRDSLGFGASKLPGVNISDASGNIVAHVSYNGRVWEGPVTGQEAKLIYENRPQPEVSNAPAQVPAPVSGKQEHQGASPRPAVSADEKEARQGGRGQTGGSNRPERQAVNPIAPEPVKKPPAVDSKGRTPEEVARLTKMARMGREVSASIMPEVKKADDPAKQQKSKFDTDAAKAQKKFLLSEIDKAIAEAKDGEANMEKHGKVTIEIPGDGTFNIVNTKKSLLAFKKMAEKFPTSTASRRLVPPKVGVNPAAPAKIGEAAPDNISKAAQSFASTEDTRLALNQVWSDGKQTIATDGRSLIVIDKGIGGTEEKPVILRDGKEVSPETYGQYPIETVRKIGEYVAGHVVAIKGADTARLFSLLHLSLLHQTFGVQPAKGKGGKVIELWKNPDGSVGVTAETSDVGKYAGNMQDGAESVGKFNPDYLIDALNAARMLGNEKVDILTKPKGVYGQMPVVIQGDGMKVVIMPGVDKALPIIATAYRDEAGAIHRVSDTDAFAAHDTAPEKVPEERRGFVDQQGNFLNRTEGMEAAQRAGLVDKADAGKPLHSEMLREFDAAKQKELDKGQAAEETGAAKPEPETTPEERIAKLVGDTAPKKPAKPLVPPPAKAKAKTMVDPYEHHENELIALAKKDDFAGFNQKLDALQHAGLPNVAASMYERFVGKLEGKLKEGVSRENAQASVTKDLYDSIRAKDASTPTIETDPARVQEIRNSIAEGEMILSSGKTVAGRKMTAAELDAVRKSVENSKRKIGEQPAEMPAPKPLPDALNAGDKVKAPKGATFLQVKDMDGKSIVVSASDVDTLKDAGPYKSAVWGIKGKAGFVPMPKVPEAVGKKSVRLAMAGEGDIISKGVAIEEIQKRVDQARSKIDELAQRIGRDSGSYTSADTIGNRDHDGAWREWKIRQIIDSKPNGSRYASIKNDEAYRSTEQGKALISRGSAIGAKDIVFIKGMPPDVASLEYDGSLLLNTESVKNIRTQLDHEAGHTAFRDKSSPLRKLAELVDINSEEAKAYQRAYENSTGRILYAYELKQEIAVEIASGRFSVNNIDLLSSIRHVSQAIQYVESYYGNMAKAIEAKYKLPNATTKPAPADIYAAPWKEAGFKDEQSFRERFEKEAQHDKGEKPEEYARRIFCQGLKGKNNFSIKGGK